MDRGPPPSALPLAHSSITSDQRDWSQDLEQDAVWVISVLLGMAWRYIGNKNHPRSSDIPKFLSYFGPQNKSSLCPNFQPLQQGYLEWILRVGWAWFPHSPAASTPLALLPSLASPESFSEWPHCTTALEIRQAKRKILDQLYSPPPCLVPLSIPLPQLPSKKEDSPCHLGSIMYKVQQPRAGPIVPQKEN